MADVFSPEKRSDIMARVKSGSNKATELRVVEILRAYKISGWRRRTKMFGKPDFVFRESRVAVFIDGCFWHCCPTHGSVPKTNRAFWKRKFARNRSRDRLVDQKLRNAGWQVVRIWQHELRDQSAVALRLKFAIGQERSVSGSINARRAKSRSD